MPLGHARKRALMKYRLKDGLLQSGASGGKLWNPLTSGVTVLMLKQYNRYQSFDTVAGKNDYTIHPLKMGLLYDNTDFPSNPSLGSSQYVAVSRDFGWLESEKSWTFIEFEASKYFDIGPSRLARQQVLALNFWTADALTWKEHIDDQGYEVIDHRPPFSDGSTLGGLYRMRAYPTGRFNDRSAIYTTAEYRYTPHWNPIKDISWLRFLRMDWWQLVGCIEGGRVAGSYDFKTLLSDWQYDGGLGLRAMMAGGVVRLDFAYSDEGVGIWAMFGHPF